MMTEFSVVQIIGRALNVPYWRVGESRKIFVPDKMVLADWRKQYADMGPMLIPYMQSQLIACGETSVLVTGQLDDQTRDALDRCADKFGVKNRIYPNFEMFKALGMNRLLDRGTASSAWAAYAAYKGGSRPAAAPTASTPSPGRRPQHEPVTNDIPRPAPARPVTPAPDLTQPLEGLL